MSEINDGGPAFPYSVRRREKYMDAAGYGRERTVTLDEGGMSLRDYFAAKAPFSLDDARWVCGYREADEGWSDDERRTVLAVLAMLRMEYADAMLAARGKP